MLGWRDLPGQEEMEMEAATFNAWTRKRYLEQGKKHAYFIYDYLPVNIDFLLARNARLTQADPLVHRYIDEGPRSQSASEE